jgi:hypothetical protein
MGRIQTMAQNDARRILNEMGFETPITFTKDSNTSIINGLGLIHHLTFDTDGNAVNSKNAHITVCEAALLDAGFITRTEKNEVYMRDVLISFFDSTGLVKTYIVKENYHDESLGLILLTLGMYVE